MKKRADPRIIKAGMQAILSTLKGQAAEEILEDIRTRFAILLEKYHALHVAPIGMKVEWLEAVIDWRMRPWWQRLWLRLTGSMPDLAYPDIDAAVQAKMDELSEHFTANCVAVMDGERCVLEADHEGPHQRPSKVAPGEMVEWETEPEDKAA